MKKVLIWIFLLLLSFFYLWWTFWYDVPPHDGYLTFENWVISPEDEIEIENYIYSIREETDVEIAVVIVQSLNWEEIWKVWHQIGEEWWVWDREKDNGIVILVSILDRKWTIRVWYWLEWVITDARARIIWENNFPEYFREWDYAGWIMEAIKDIHLYLVNDPEVAYNLSLTKWEYFIQSLNRWHWPLAILYGIPESSIFTFVWIFYFFFWIILLNKFVVKKVGGDKKMREYWWTHFMIISLLFSAILILLTHNIVRSFLVSYSILIFTLMILTSDTSWWGWWYTWGWYSWSSSSSFWSSSGWSFWWFGWGSFWGGWASWSW